MLLRNGINGRTSFRRSRQAKSSSNRTRRRLVSEQLEARKMLTTFVVNSLADLGMGTLPEAVGLASNNSANVERLDFGAVEFGPEEPSLVVTIASDTVANDGETSLREAVTFANSKPGADTVAFDPSLTAISVTNGEIAVNESLTIEGPGADQLTINGSYGSRLFYANLSATDSFTVRDVTVSGAGSAGFRGGVIYSPNDASVHVDSSRLTGNTATSGGAVFSCGTVSVDDSEISGNYADFSGGGIRVSDGALAVTNSTISGNNASAYGGGGISVTNSPTTITNSTLSGNTGDFGGAIDAIDYDNVLTIRNSTIAGNFGGGIYTDHGGGNTIENSIIANNTTAGGGDVSGAVTANFSMIRDISRASVSGSNNLTGVDPRLHPLANNGGATLTHALGKASLAINAGDPNAVAGVGDTPRFDQRGANRIFGGRLDIGAYEVHGSFLLCDFTVDGICDGADIDALQDNIVNGPFNSLFDLNGDTQVSVADRDEWLTYSGNVLGDANLDGRVDGADFQIWSSNKFTSNSAWTSGDLTADGSVDGRDFLVWNANKSQGAGSAAIGKPLNDNMEDEETTNSRHDELFKTVFADLRA